MNISHVTVGELLPSMPTDYLPFLKHISKIDPSDKVLLEKAVQQFRPTSKSYEDSWGYIIQSTRYGGFKFYNPTTGVLIFFGRKTAKDSTLVIPSFFSEPRYLAKVIENVQKELEVSNSILKNINPEELKTFLPYGFREYTQDECWNPIARFDDQTYPQQIIDLERLTDIRESSFHKLRSLLNKKFDVTIRKYTRADRNAVFKLLTLKDEHTEESHKMSDSMYYESHKMYPDSDIEKFIILNKTTKKVVGFIAISDITPTTTASVASIFHPDAKQTSAWCEYQILLEKYQQGFHFANLGGSEYEGDNNFKLWTFRPVKNLKKTHLVYDP